MFEAFEQTLYVQVWENRFDIWHVQENSAITEYAAEPFTTERMAIGRWAPAESTLNKAVSQICPKSFFKLSPTMVMQQMVKTDGGLCEVEERILRELALGSGAKKVYLWSGQPLTREQLLEKKYENAA